MKRRHRWLRGNKGSEAPSNLVFLAVERQSHDDPTNRKRKIDTLRQWCIIAVRLESGRSTRRREYIGTTREAFWETLADIATVERTTWLFGESIGVSLTVLGFWEQLDARNYTLDPLYRSDSDESNNRRVAWRGRLCIDNRTTFVTCRSGHKTFRFVDTGNYWPKNLRNIGISAGILPDGTDGSVGIDGEGRYTVNQLATTVEYAVTQLILGWTREKCGVFQMTAPMLAMTNWRHTTKLRRKDSESLDIECDPDSPQHELERDSYYGGRIQPFYCGEQRGRIYHLDVNSLYPGAMRANRFPRRFAGFDYAETVAGLLDKMAVYGAVADVYIESQWDSFPVRIDDEQYHAIGRYWTVLCGPELRRALASGCVARIGRVQYYSLAPMFAEWVDYWYARKLNAAAKVPKDTGEYELCKLILNSLSGKWAQKGRHWIDVPDRVALIRWGGWSEQLEPDGKFFQFRGVAGYTQTLTDVGEPNHAFPLISAYITAHGREYMRDIIQSLPEYSVYYIATDSLICDQRAYDTLLARGMIHPTKIGLFKLVGIHSECTIIGANHYILDGVETVAGLFSKGGIVRREFDTVEMVEPLSSIIHHPPTSEITVTRHTLLRGLANPKGTIDQSGWWTPYRLSDDPDFSDRPPSHGYDSGILGDYAKRPACPI